MNQRSNRDSMDIQAVITFSCPGAATLWRQLQAFNEQFVNRKHRSLMDRFKPQRATYGTQEQFQVQLCHESEFSYFLPFWLPCGTLPKSEYFCKMWFTSPLHTLVNHISQMYSLTPWEKNWCTFYISRFLAYRKMRLFSVTRLWCVGSRPLILEFPLHKIPWKILT